VIDFMFGLVGKLNKHTKVLDFECGSGGFLATAVDENELPMENVLGVDIEELPFIIAKTYFALYFKKIGAELELIPVRQDNGLFYHGNNWDLVIGNPAGSSKYEHDELEKIYENLNSDLDHDGKPDKITEYGLSIQQAVRSARVGGKICLVLPEGLFSNSQDEILRKFLSKYCRILAIISLPRGVFKRGTDVKQLSKGAQSASMKMSILMMDKAREIEDSTGIEVDNKFLDYSVFLAFVDDVDSKAGEIGDWLQERLDLVLQQWQEWQNKGELAAIEKVTIKIIDNKNNNQQVLFASLPAKEILNKQAPRLKEIKSTTKINESLEDLLG
jgi:SAM-dependent methyltransferase